MKGLIQIHEKDSSLINCVYLQLGWTMYLIENNLYEAVKYWEYPIRDADKFPKVKVSNKPSVVPPKLFYWTPIISIIYKHIYHFENWI